MPTSLAQYEFYRQAIELSPDVFGKHKPYDDLIDELDNNLEFADAVAGYDINWIQDNSLEYSDLIKQFDLGIEDRARHYTSNLVKLGFADENRVISDVGSLLLDLKKLKKDKLEKMLPIDGVNIVYLRQLLKLRLFDKEGERFYSPFNLAIYALLKRHRLSENEFSELVQGLSPYSDFTNICDYVVNYKEGGIVADIEVDVPNSLQINGRIPENEFRTHFKNRKSNSAVDVYWNFYTLLYEFGVKKDVASMENLLSYYEDNRTMLNKAFGKGQNLFIDRAGVRPNRDDFLENFTNMYEDDINVNIYKQFFLSKLLDQIREYSDTTKRIFKATGIISFDNGYVELAYRELCECIFDEEILEHKIAGLIADELHPEYDCYEEYEDGVNSFFCSNTSVSEIFQYYEAETKTIEDKIKIEFPNTEFEDIAGVVESRRKQEFAEYLNRVYPLTKVKEILALFADRSNDKTIKEMVSKDATVPTIYEYIVGIAWYYFSGKRIDLLGSFNLTLSANFEPLMHAGGGQGDIVIYENDKVVMLEATLMNANSQKRGEWEPVLRHSINLKVEEETANTERVVTTFFIADTFDYNTINIWKAVASVPLQSSVDKDKFTDNVVIMPISTEELSGLMDKNDEYDEMITKVHRLFEVDKVNFDINWRDKFMNAMVN